MPTYITRPVFNRHKALIAARSPVVKYVTATSTWPARPTATVVIWSGGTTAPPAAVDGDLWIP